MKRPVRPVALVILTLCALYPGLSAVFQGLYPWVTGQEFTLVGQTGAFMTTAAKLAAYKLPAEITTLPSLPKNAVGKIATLIPW